MDNLTKKLNSTYKVEMQGGTIILLLKILSEEAANIQVLIDLATEAKIEVPEIERERLAAIDAIGTNLMIDAKKVFDEAYLTKVLTSRDEHIGLVDITEIEVDRVLN